MITEPVSKEHQQDLSLKPQLPKPLSPAAALLSETLNHEPLVEEKLKKTISFMKEAISQEGVPRFKDFWDAKGLCLPLFKEKLPQAIKEIYWKQYTDLALEAKRLKEILEEQSSFASEQIELAIKGLSHDVECFLSSSTASESASFKDKQTQVDALLAFTTRLKGLREEVAKTEMRLRHKNRLFKEISELGDKFVPQKNELIKRVSAEFLHEIELFCQKEFDLEQKKMIQAQSKVYDVREKIKHYQELAKALSLPSSVFTKTRTLLTTAWDIVKNEEKERKKLFLEKKEQEAKMLDESLADIDQKLSVPFSSKEELQSVKQQLLSAVEALPLRYQEKKPLKALIYEKIEEKLIPFKEVENQKEEKLRLELKEKKEKALEFKTTIETLIFSDSSLEKLKTALDGFVEEVAKLKVDVKQRPFFDELHKKLFEAILNKEQELLKNDDQSLSLLYAKWTEFKNDTKVQLELYRKQVSLSGFDFEKAMLFNDLATIQKERYERCLKKLESLSEQMDES